MMRNIKKAGLLIGLLASPALVFLYLVTFTTNHYDLPYFFPLQDDQTGEYIMAGQDSVYYTADLTLVYTASEAETCKANLISLLPEVCDEDCQLQIMNYMKVREIMEGFTDNCSHIFYGTALTDLVASAEIVNAKLIDSLQRGQLTDMLKLESDKANGAETVLLDGEGRIRGYYKLNDKAELDRLSAEIKVLNHNLTNLK